MTIPIITRTNTIDEWRIQTNQAATSLNSLETGTYTKSNGTLIFSGNSSLVITANGTALQVSNNALFQRDVTISRDVAIGVRTSTTGNVQIGAVLTVLGPGQSLLVANSATVNSNVIVGNTLTANDAYANNNVYIGQVLVVGANTTTGNITSNNSITGNNLTININAGIGSNLIVGSNTSTANLVVSEHINTQTITSTSDAIFGNTVNITGSGTALTVDNNAVVNGSIFVAGTITSNTLIANNDTLIGTNLTIGSNTITGNLTTNNSLTTSFATVNNNLTVGSNTQTSNIVATQHIQSNTFRSSGRADVGGILVVSGPATFGDDASVEGNFGVFGDFEIKGNLVYDADILTISANVPVTAGYAYIGVNRGNTTSVLGTTNANAYIRWSGPDNQFEIRDVFNTNNATCYSKILTANLISSAVNTMSEQTITSSLAANTLNNSIISVRQYADIIYAHANGGFAIGNTANQRAVTSGVYANAAYGQANTATTNAATADQKAVSAGVYANAAFTKANTTINITNDTTTDSSRFPLLVSGTSGAVTAVNVSSTKLSFNPSSGRLTATDFFASSDAKLKKDVETIESALATVNKLRGVTFKWKESGVPSMGVIANEAELVVPSLVYEIDGVKSVSYGNMVGLLIEAIKDLTKEVEELKRQVYK